MITKTLLRSTPACSVPPSPSRHYEISRYGTLRTWAEELGYADSVALLEATPEEEKATDELLSALAVSVISIEAEEGSLQATA
jgi:ferritin-like metal-binding protein YciE